MEWFGHFVSTVNRPIEFDVQRKLDENKPYSWERGANQGDRLEHDRRHNLEFNNGDWMLYLLLMHFKNRVRFGDNRRARREERKILVDIGTPRYLDNPSLAIDHAELLNKINRREKANMASIPSTPYFIRREFETLMKRANRQNVAIA